MIPIQNVYYMLSYAFRVLNEQGYKSIETEEFHNVAELCASILTKGVSLQLKRGLGKEYISETEALSSPRGKIDVTASIKDLSKVKGQLVCTSIHWMCIRLTGLCGLIAITRAIGCLFPYVILLSRDYFRRNQTDQRN